MSECDGCILENNPGGGCADAHRRGMCPTYGYKLGNAPSSSIDVGAKPCTHCGGSGLEPERCEDCGRPDCQHCE